MKYVPSAFVGQLSRSAGSTTASRNRWGSYFRNRVTPVNPRTALQTAQRTAMIDASSAWRALTAIQRTQWATLGNQIVRTDSLGQTYTLSGLQAFVSAYRTAVRFGGSVISTPPAVPATITGITSITATATA